MKCSKCNSELPEDSVFCQYCGHKIAGSGHDPSQNQNSDDSHSKFQNIFTDNNEYKSTYALDEETYTPPHSPHQSHYTPYDRKSRVQKTRKICTIVAIIFFGIIVLGAIANFIQEEAESDSTPPRSEFDHTPTVSEPLNGAILSGKEYYNASELTVTASSGESCVVKLKDRYGNTALSFYVRAGSTVTMGVPAKYLYVYFASGDTWYGNEHLFGEYTSYSMDDEIVDFSRYTMTYTLYPVTNGNFSETPIDEDEFK